MLTLTSQFTYARSNTATTNAPELKTPAALVPTWVDTSAVQVIARELVIPANNVSVTLGTAAGGAAWTTYRYVEIVNVDTSTWVSLAVKGVGNINPTYWTLEPNGGRFIATLSGVAGASPAPDPSQWLMQTITSTGGQTAPAATVWVVLAGI